MTTAGGDGVSFPKSDGERPTTPTLRAILADAARAVDAGLADRIAATSDWRSGYLRRVRELTVASAASSDAATAIADAGLASMRARMVVDRGDATVAVEEALAARSTPGLARQEVHGPVAPDTELRVPYGGRVLHGATLDEQLERWLEASVVEPSFAAAIRRVGEHPEWLRLAGRRVALVGAGAEMGPLEPLSAWGAHVLAIDLPSEAIWQRITDIARRGAGTVTFPTSPDGVAGVDVLRALPQTRAWLEDAAADDELVLGMHAYANGGSHVRVTAAVDVIATDLLAQRPSTALAYLATPTDAFVVPEEVVAHARAAYAARGLRAVAQAPLRVASRGRLFKPAYADGSSVADVLVRQQGPNYAVAKRLQRWRGVTARRQGHTVSFNVAPATWTRSVIKNRVLAAAYAGAGRFGIEIFEPATVRVLMAALLVHDLHHAPAAGRHPETLFSDSAAHGGLWRAAYEPASVLGLAAVTGLHTTLRRHPRSDQP